MSNRLAKETSPYLLQHQHNPVDWYSWGPEAFSAAKALNKPIFLSVGYSTCYWCHVMERQCFENESIASVMNKLFINIKVDREERPDVDQLYMTAVQLLTRQGGWPMSVFLLPDRRPFYGGTYFPPADGHGRPGFPRLLTALRDAYDNRRADVEQTADELTRAIKTVSNPVRESRPLNRAMIDRLIERSTTDYEPEFGGFGSAPKFPRETLLELLLVHHRREPNLEREGMIKHTLDAMANGGIRDQLGGGFHRYSTDARWLVPHFEIMLYDNAMLAWIYAEASQQFSNDRYGRITRGICDFVLRDMTDPAGSFYTAFDAEVDGQEGLNYLWTEIEIESVLEPEEASIFKRVYGLDEGPNFADPQHGNGYPEANILHLPNGPARELDPVLASAREKLLAVRGQRKQPLLDTKILTSWNALMIRGLAHAGEVLQEPRYTAAANKAADWLLAHHRQPDGKLLRTSRDGGPAKYDGFLDDYAFLAHAMIALGRHDDARSIVQSMNERFGDEAGGLFFTDRSSHELFSRQKTISDSPLPSGNGIAAQVLLALGERDAAGKLLESFAGAFGQDAGGMSAILQAAGEFINLAPSRGAPALGSEAQARRGEGWREGDVEGSRAVAASAAWQGDRTALVTVTIADGYHINANRVPAGLIKTELIATPTATIAYPPAKKFADDLDVYTGTITLIATWPSPPTESIRLRLNYQPCTDTACLEAKNLIIDLQR